MGLLSALLDPGFRQAASVLIQPGDDLRDIGPLAALISSVEVNTGRAEAADATITFDDRRDEAGRFMAADSGLFEPWTPVRISADFETHTEEILRGHIIGLKPEFPQNGGEAKLVVEIQDESAALNREHIRRVWGDEDQPVSDRDILTESISPLGLTAASGPEGAAARALSQDASAAQFLRERAKANGFEMIFARGEVYFGPMQLEADPQAPIMIYAGAATNCLNFSIEEDAQKPASVAFEAAPRDDGDEVVAEVIGPDQPVLGQRAAGDAGAGLSTPSTGRISREGDETVEEIRARAQGLANENSFRIIGTGELDGALYGHVLLPGKPVKVDGAGERNGGLYYVDSVTHQFTPDGYRQKFRLLRNATGESDGLSAAPLNSAISAISSLF